MHSKRSFPKAIAKFAIVLAACLFITIRCSDKGDNDPVKIEEPEKDVIVMTDPSDPMILLAKQAKGTRLEYYGLRDDQGLPTRITEIISKNQQDTIIYRFDEVGRLSGMTSLNGVQFELEWLSKTKATLTAITKDGANQINTILDFEEAGNGRISQPKNVKNIREGKHAKLSINSRAYGTQNARTEAQNNCTVNVKACGEPTSGQIFVRVKEYVSNDFVGDFPAQFVSDGVYKTSIPTDKLPITDNKATCEAVKDALDMLCTANELIGPNAGYICAVLTVAAGSLNPLAAELVLSACGSFMGASEFYCATLGASPAPQAPSIMSELVNCNASFFDREFKDLVVYAYLVGMPYNSYSSSQKINGATLSTSSLTFNLDLGSKTYVRSLTLNPPSPAEDQDYDATADVSCLPTGSSISLSIVGSDGYTDEVSTTYDSNQPNVEFTLSVPGAATGVQDVVTLTIIRPDGESITRTASLVFN